MSEQHRQQKKTTYTTRKKSIDDMSEQHIGHEKTAYTRERTPMHTPFVMPYGKWSVLYFQQVFSVVIHVFQFAFSEIYIILTRRMFSSV